MKKFTILILGIIALLSLGCEPLDNTSQSSGYDRTSRSSSNTTIIAPSNTRNDDRYSGSSSRGTTLGSPYSSPKSSSNYGSSGSSYKSTPSPSAPSTKSYSGHSDSSFGKSYSTPPKSSGFGKSWKFMDRGFGKGYRINPL